MLWKTKKVDIHEKCIKNRIFNGFQRLLKKDDILITTMKWSKIWRIDDEGKYSLTYMKHGKQTEKNDLWTIIAQSLNF